MSEDFTVLGKVTNEDGSVMYVCMINGKKWWVPDDLDNVDRQKVQAWIDDGNPMPDLTAEEASKL